MTGDLARAVERLTATGSTCVLCRGEQVLADTRRGVAPLLGFLDSGESVRGFSAADRVVGKAAALLYIRLGVVAVHALVMSRPAYDTLSAHSIAATYDTLVPAIINRAGDGGCPMERAVWELDDPVEGERVLRRRLAELKSLVPEQK